MSRSQFLKVFADLPCPLRREVIAFIDGQPMTWNVAYVEIKNETKLGDKILAQLKRLKNNMTKIPEEVKELVIARLNILPPDVIFSIGNFGSFTRDELISEVKKGTEVGVAAIEMQINFIKKMPQLITRVC